MTDYTKLVKALRYCGNFAEREGCAESCEYFNDMDCPNRIMSDAAAAIEDMAKHIAEMHERVTVLQIDRGHLETEVKELRRLNNENLFPKRGEIVRCRECRWGTMCVTGHHLGLDGFCSKGEREVQE